MQALLLSSSEEGIVRAAMAGQDDVRVFTRAGSLWRAEDGQVVQLRFAGQPEDSHFVCSRQLGRQLISNLLNGSETKEDGPCRFYVFSGEKRRLHITVLGEQQPLAG